MKKIFVSTLILICIAPFTAFALTKAPSSGLSSCSNITSGFSALVSCALSIINSVIPIIIALMIVWVTWSAFNMTRVEGEKRDEYRNAILYGIVGIFVAVSIYGLVAILTGTFFNGNPSSGIKVVNTTTSITQQ